jgi:hypothetical protein
MAERIGCHVAVGLRGATTWNDAAFSGDYSVLHLLFLPQRKAAPDGW